MCGKNKIPVFLSGRRGKKKKKVMKLKKFIPDRERTEAKIWFSSGPIFLLMFFLLLSFSHAYKMGSFVFSPILFSPRHTILLKKLSHYILKARSRFSQIRKKHSLFSHLPKLISHSSHHGVVYQSTRTFSQETWHRGIQNRAHT